MAEVAVHFTLATLPLDYRMITIFIPEDVSLKKLSRSDLPDDWNVFPHPVSTQQIGDRFIAEGRHCILQVPSAVVKGDYNVVINPKHPEFESIKIIAEEKFPFDKRIFK